VIASFAVFILLIACINFMNLSTAKATKRANEIGLRKVMGAFRSSLIRQFMGEAFVIVFISILLSIIMVQVALPGFNELTSKSISFTTENILYIGAMLLVIAFVTGILAGSYPALYLSSFQPAQALKGKLSLSNSNGWLRQSLVVFQFMIAIALVCGMIIITDQLNFLQEKNLGFDSHAKMVFPLRTSTAQKQYETLKKELSGNSFVQTVSGADYMPGSIIWSDMSFYTAGGNMDKAIIHRRNNVDQEYQDLLGIKLIAGRKFSTNREMESKGKLIVNRTSAKKFGFEPEKIIGQPLYFDWQGKQYSFEVIGVMEDYHQTTLKEEINPTMFQIPESAVNYGFMIVSVDPTNIKSTVASIEKTWKSLVNDTPFEYSFLDENIQKQYDEDRKVASIITSFTLIAMFISCLGLYGLSTFMAERRFKEIGVRKVMGASIQQILTLMSKEFIKLIIIAFVIAVPIAWYAMDKWLQGFAYKIAVNPMVFVYAGLIALVIALLTVSFESLKAAIVNPIKSLRSE
jgi:putative ABC transport system permease protein